MGFLEKFKLVEDTNIEDSLSGFNELSNNQGVSLDEYLDKNVNINVDGVTTAEDIYKENNLLDKSKSIFKAEEIKNVLPNNLPNDAKKASVIGMLGVAQLTIDEILLDASQRIDTLNSALNKFAQETIIIIENGDLEIKKLEDEINVLKEKINSRKKSQEDQENIINEEIGKINNIVNFIK